jgi:ribosomal protein S6
MASLNGGGKYGTVLPLSNKFFAMPKTDMPAAEAGDSVSYELAFHVLPTVAEGEVPAVFDKLKAALTKAGAEIIDEEAPKRFDLAYEIVKYLEGRNRKFSSAYFGWVRFTAEPEVVEAMPELLRHLLIKLNKAEAAFPFRFHEALEVKPVETVDEDAEADEEAKESEKEATEDAEDTSEETTDASDDAEDTK